jgi:AbrB family looped-hinge helix DNA binding protein
MRVSTISSNGQTTVPKEIRDELDLKPGAKLRWDIRGGTITITTERPLLWQWEGFIKHGEPDAVKAVAAARRTRGRF